MENTITIPVKWLLNLLVPAIKEEWATNPKFYYASIFKPYRAYMIKKFGEYEFFLVTDTDMVLKCLNSVADDKVRFTDALLRLNDYNSSEDSCIDGCFSMCEDEEGIETHRMSEWIDLIFDVENEENFNSFVLDVLNNREDENYAPFVKILDGIM